MNTLLRDPRVFNTSISSTGFQPWLSKLTIPVLPPYGLINIRVLKMVVGRAYIENMRPIMLKELRRKQWTGLIVKRITSSCSYRIILSYLLINVFPPTRCNGTCLMVHGRPLHSCNLTSWFSNLTWITSQTGTDRANRQ